MNITPAHRDITNYLRNELGITREYIDEVVQKSIANTVKQFLTNKATDAYIERVIGAAITNYVSNGTPDDWRGPSTKEKFSAAVLAETKKAVGKLLEKELSVCFSISPTPPPDNDFLAAAYKEANKS